MLLHSVFTHSSLSNQLAEKLESSLRPTAIDPVLLPGHLSWPQKVSLPSLGVTSVRGLDECRIPPGTPFLDQRSKDAAVRGGRVFESECPSNLGRRGELGEVLVTSFAGLSVG